MKKIFISFLLCSILLLSSCNTEQATRDSNEYQIGCTTYPIYLLTQAVTDGVEGVSVALVIDQQVSCLHNYTLTMRDMEVIERADLLIENGAGLEDFLDDVLDGRNVLISSDGVDLLESKEHDSDHDHDIDEESDPHIWMDPRNAAVMVQNIATGLASRDPEHEEQYLTNGEAAAQELNTFYEQMLTLLDDTSYDLITFHDGFAYFAGAFNMNLLAAIEEEEGSEPSAKTVKDITDLVAEYNIPAVFTEVNGSDATAQTICRECGIATYPISMCMSGDGNGLAAYKIVIQSNIETIMEAYQ